jgi:hypothetical protein
LKALEIAPMRVREFIMKVLPSEVYRDSLCMGALFDRLTHAAASYTTVART